MQWSKYTKWILRLLFSKHFDQVAWTLIGFAVYLYKIRNTDSMNPIMRTVAILLKHGPLSLKYRCTPITLLWGQHIGCFIWVSIQINVPIYSFQCCRWELLNHYVNIISQFAARRIGHCKIPVQMSGIHMVKHLYDSPNNDWKSNNVQDQGPWRHMTSQCHNNEMLSFHMNSVFFCCIYKSYMYPLCWLCKKWYYSDHRSSH